MVACIPNLSIFLLISGSSINCPPLILSPHRIHLLKPVVNCLIVVIIHLATGWLRMLVNCRIQCNCNKVLYRWRIILGNWNISRIYLLGRIIIFTMGLNKLCLILLLTIFLGFGMMPLRKGWLVFQKLAKLTISCFFSRWNQSSESLRQISSIGTNAAQGAIASLRGGGAVETFRVQFEISLIRLLIRLCWMLINKMAHTLIFSQ